MIPLRRLNSGFDIPLIGLGTWEITKPQVDKAIELGYRHIDTAWSYLNQYFLGECVRESGIDREEFFIRRNCSRHPITSLTLAIVSHFHHYKLLCETYTWVFR